MLPFTRRRFLATLGASTVVWAAGCRREVRTSYDVVVVGSGFAGLMVALATARAGLHTLVLETGGDFGRGAVRAPVFENTGSVAYPIDSTRVLALGGTSNHWTGVCGRLSAEDLKTKTLYGLDVDWPITYDDLDPWYCKAEQALHLIGRAPVAAAPARSCAYPKQEDGYTGPELMGPDEKPYTFVPTAKSFRKPGPVRLTEEELPAFQRLEHGTLLSEHQVVRVLTEGGRATGVEAVDSVGKRQRFTARTVVVAAGVVETPRLLLHSGLGGEHVGRHFNAHPNFGWRWAKSKLAEGLTGRSHRTADVATWLRKQGLSAAHLQLDVDPKSRWVMQLELEPHPDKRITLASAADKSGVPTVRLHMQHTERDEKTRAAARALLDQQRKVLGVPADADQLDGWRAHPAGTCRMSTAASQGVVDAELGVHGVAGLYVSGASVFPTSGTANPTLTVVALALRLGEHLSKKLAGA